VGSLLLALFVVPALCSVALKSRMTQLRLRTTLRKGFDQGSWNARLLENLRTRYDRTLTVAFRQRKAVLAGAAALVLAALVSLKFIGTEFMPTLDEGSMIVTSKRLPGISLTESVAIGEKIETIIKSFPEVQSVVTKLGRPDLATEAMGVEESDSYISFTPEMRNASPARKEEFYTRLRNKLETIPGLSYEFSQPMQMRMDETITGTRGAVALKIFGADLNTLDQLAQQSQKTIAGVPGAVGTQMQHLSGAEELQVQIDRAQAARYGVNVAQVQETIEALYGGKQVSEMITGNERFPIALRLPDNLRNDPDYLRGLQIKTASGDLIRLDQIAQVRSVPGPNIISREEAHRRAVVVSNVSGRDLGSFVKEARAAVDRDLHLPQGYWLEWGGQYENQVRAEQRLAIVLPVSILIIAGLLYASFQNVRQVLLILLIVPLALVGGIAALWIREINLNLSASIGFIALFGIAVLNGIVMVSHINSLRDQGKDMEEAVREGASDRLRPVLITALVASLGFIPMALATSRGAEVERPLATVVIGGLLTATLLTLYVLPLLYPWFSKPWFNRTKQPALEEVATSV
jgi:heavy metal efflux system protein